MGTLCDEKESSRFSFLRNDDGLVNRNDFLVHAYVDLVHPNVLLYTWQNLVLWYILLRTLVHT